MWASRPTQAVHTQPTFASSKRRGRTSCVHGPARSTTTATLRGALGHGASSSCLDARRSRYRSLRGRGLAPPPRRGAPVPRLCDRCGDAPWSRGARSPARAAGRECRGSLPGDRRADRAVHLARRSPRAGAGRRGARHRVASHFGRRSRPGGRQLDRRAARAPRRAAKAAAGASLGVEPRPSRGSSSASRRSRS